MLMKPAFLEYIKTERDKVNKHIVRLFSDYLNEDDEPFLRKFLKADLDFLIQGGRRLLPLSVINAFMGLSSDRDIAEMTEEVYRMSTSIEMLHIGTIIHDDYIDKEEIRSGNPTFHKFMAESFKDMKEQKDFENAVAIVS